MTRLQDVDSPDNPHTLNTALSQTIAVQTTAESGISKSSSNSFEGSHETEKEAIETIAKDDFPDGGLRAWFVVLASSFIMAMSFGMCNSYADRFDDVFGCSLVCMYGLHWPAGGGCNWFVVSVSLIHVFVNH